jgi:DNA polymerase-3 subunit delta
MFLLLHGDDEFSAREELARLRASGGFDFNQDVFSGDDADIAQIRAICDTLPFLSERRLVVLLGLPRPKRGAAGNEDDSDDSDDSDDGDDAEPTAESTKTAGKGKKGKTSGLSPRAFIQALADYAPHVPETSTLVVVAGRLEPGSPLLKAAQQHGRARVFSPLKGAQLEQWITQRAQAGDASITPDAARLLVESVGAEHLRALDSELEKLCIAVGHGGRIGIEQVRALASHMSLSNIFELTDAMARRDRGHALALLHEQLADGTAPQAIVGLIAAQTRRLIQVKAMAERGMRAGQIAEAAGLAPFVADKTLALARQFTFAQLEAAHRALLEVDVALKSSRMTADLALDLLTLQFGEVTH